MRFSIKRIVMIIYDINSKKKKTFLWKKCYVGYFVKRQRNDHTYHISVWGNCTVIKLKKKKHKQPYLFRRKHTFRCHQIKHAWTTIIYIVYIWLNNRPNRKKKERITWKRQWFGCCTQSSWNHNDQQQQQQKTDSVQKDEDIKTT